MKHLAWTTATKYDTDANFLWSVYYQSLLFSAAGRPHAFSSPLLSLVRLQSSSLNCQPSNRPTLPICLDTNTRTARPAAVYSEVRSVAQAVSHAWVGTGEAGRGLRQSSVDGSYCDVKPASIEYNTKIVHSLCSGTSLLFTCIAPKPPIRYNTIAIRLSFRWSNYWNHMFELLKVEKIIIFFQKFACSNY